MAMGRWAALFLALACAACAGQQAMSGKAPAWPPFASAPAMPAPVEAVAPASASQAEASAAGGPELFACADGGRLELQIAADRGSAVARWDDGAALALSRADENGQMSFAGGRAVLLRAGPRAAWRPAASIVVAPGDTLSKLALSLYGDMSRAGEIAAANADAVRDPNRIYVGQVLRLPAGERVCRRVGGPI
jgi:nucleoid-associated protein YgaU